MPSSFVKDPDAVLDYAIDWTAYLVANAEEISSSAWSVSPVGALTVDSDDNSATATVVWLSGGDDGADVDVTNTIVTTDGRTDQRTLRIQVRQR